MEVTIDSNKLVYNLLSGHITYLYRGYNPVTKTHGHPSIYPIWSEVTGNSMLYIYYTLYIL